MYLDLCGRRVPFQALGSSSFAEFLSSYAPQLLPGGSWPDLPAANGTAVALPHATTIVATVCDEGVVLASDRRATATGSGACPRLRWQSSRSRSSPTGWILPNAPPPRCAPEGRGPADLSHLLDRLYLPFPKSQTIQVPQ